MSAPLPSVALRDGTPADLPAVSEVMAEAFEPRFGEAWTSAQCMGMLSLPGAWLTLAFDGDVLAGFALARAIAGDGELLLLGVRPERRGAGIGGALLRSVVAEAAARDAECLHLEVRACNPAVRLYGAHGFEKIGERRGYYRGRDGLLRDAHSFRRQLR